MHVCMYDNLQQEVDEHVKGIKAFKEANIIFC